MAQPNLRVVQPSPLGVPWPDPNDVADLLAIIEAQTKTMADQAAMIDRYQGVLNAAQAQTPPPQATGTGTSTGTTALTLAGVINTVAIGATISGAGVPSSPPTTIVSQTSGTTGGNGVYVTSVATTLAGVPLTLTPPPPSPVWPIPRDAPTLMLLLQNQSAVTRTQAALISHYQDVLNTSQTPIA
ncbi:MAG TPA: hypothetical protein VGJ20_20635 [Xanthobacteraceae bacterium]|jgi:hypothetical protein